MAFESQTQTLTVEREDDLDILEPDEDDDFLQENNSSDEEEDEGDHQKGLVLKQDKGSSFLSKREVD